MYIDVNAPRPSRKRRRTSLNALRDEHLGQRAYVRSIHRLGSVFANAHESMGDYTPRVHAASLAPASFRGDKSTTIINQAHKAQDTARKALKADANYGPLMSQAENAQIEKLKMMIVHEEIDRADMPKGARALSGQFVYSIDFQGSANA